MTDPHGGGGAAGKIEWDQEKLTEYFAECEENYIALSEALDQLTSDFTTFASDKDHLGPEAEAARAYIEDRQIPLHEDLKAAVTDLTRMQKALLAAFNAEVDGASNAILKEEQLEKVRTDHKAKYTEFNALSQIITEQAERVNASCAEFGPFTVPNPTAVLEMFESFDEWIRLLIEKFLEFDATQAADFESTDIKGILTNILYAVKLMIASLGDGESEAKAFTDVNNALEEALVSGSIEPVNIADYEAFVEDLDAYFKGIKTHCQVFGYDPINLCTGGYVEEKEDIGIGGRYPLSFTRAYNALNTEKGLLGRGWSTSAEQRLRKEDEKTYIRITASGGEDRFVKAGEDREGNGIYLEAHGEAGTLKEDGGKGYTLTYDEGRYVRFDKDGYLTEEGDHNGRLYRVLYDGIPESVKEACGPMKRPLKIETPAGAYLLLSYDDKGQIESVTDHTGRKVSYAYEDDRLSSVTTVTGHTKRYVYDERGLLSEGYNARGNRYVKNEYDEDGRIVTQTLANGAETRFSYDDEKGITAVTEACGNEVLYYRDEKKRHTGTKYYDGEEHYTYNERNLKTSYTDKNGNTTRYSYDHKGRLRGITNALKESISITYDDKGRISVVKDALGNKTHYRYDIYGNLSEIRQGEAEATKLYYDGRDLLKIRDEEGNETTFSYDEAGNVKSVTDADKVSTHYESDALNRIVAVRDMNGHTTRLAYDAAGRVTSRTNALNEIERFTYNPSGKLEQVEHADGTTRSITYNQRGKVERTTDEEGRTTGISYDLMGREESITLPNGGKISFTRDPLGRITERTDAEGCISTYRYDAAGNLLEEKTGKEALTYTYDALNRVTGVTDAEGRTSKRRYDARGNLCEVTDPKGGVTSLSYDAYGRLIREVHPNGEEKTYSYTLSGRIKSVKEGSILTELHYTKAGRLESVALNGKRKEAYRYDEAGRVKERSFSDGYTLFFTYDAVNRVEQVQDTAGRCIRYAYDKRGRILEVTDGEAVTQYAYTKTGQLSGVTDALDHTTRYTYDEMDALACVDRMGQVTTYERDLNGRILKVIDALLQEERYTYNEEGHLESKTDRDGYETSYVYNRAGLVASVTYGDGKQVKLSYDPLDKICEIIDHLGTTTIGNDESGRVTKIKDYAGREISYAYAYGTRKSAITYPDGHSAYYRYDEDGNLSALEDLTGVTTYAYDLNGRLSAKCLPNGVRQTYAYAQGGFLERMESFDERGLLDRYTYAYNKEGLRSRAQVERRDLPEVSGVYSYAYDTLRRLTQVERNEEILKRYGYDALGNRAFMEEEEGTTTYTYDILDRLTEEILDKQDAEETRTYAYDRRGNLSSLSVNGVETKRYTFDARNLLTGARDSEKGEITHEYNGLGFRVETKKPEEEITYLCDLTRQYYNLLERTVNGITEQFAYDTNVVSMRKEGEDFFYLQDALGSPMYLTGTDGAPVGSYAFDDFGRSLDPYTGRGKRDKKYHPYRKEGNIIQPFAFTGYLEDDITDLHYAQARYYDNRTGRFVSEDLVRGFIEEPKTLNHYIYCWNDPEDYVDLDGRLGFLATMGIGAAIGAVIGGGASIVSDLVNGRDIDWGKAGSSALAGAAAGAAIGSGAHIVTLAAGHLSAAGTIVAGSMKTGALVGGVMSSTIEAGRQIVSGEDIDIGRIAISGTSGTASGLLMGSPIGRLGSTIGGGLISSATSVATDFYSGERDPFGIAFRALTHGATGAFSGLLAGPGATSKVYVSRFYDNIYSPVETISYVGRALFGDRVKEAVKKEIIAGSGKMFLGMMGEYVIDGMFTEGCE